MTQETALSILKTGGNVFLTGEPGSGKTYTINRYIAYLKERGIEPAVTASTGIAATHIGGMTIHSWSGIGIKNELSQADFGKIVSLKRASVRIKKSEILIIDEISMLDGRILDLIDKVCRVVKKSPKPFGGMQMVFVGDFFQLPPVRKEWEESYQFAFESQAWTDANPAVCYLTEQYRQSDQRFISVLSAIRSNNFLKEHRQYLDQCLVSHDAPKIENVTKFFPHNEEVNRINSEKLEKLAGKSVTFVMEGEGKNNLVEQLKRGCLSPEKLELKKGAAVMFTKNNFKSGFANGTIGTVVDFDQYEEGNYPIIKTRQGRKLIAKPMEWMIEENGNLMAKVKQVPLRLAWAMTIHKSQGITLDAAFIDLNQAFVEGQGYVAISRVKTLEGLHLAGYNDKALSVSSFVLRQDDIFRAFSNEVELKHTNLNKEEIGELHNRFILKLGGDIKTDIKSKSKKEGQSKNDDFTPQTTKEKGWRKSLSLINEGRTIFEISQMRGLAEETIIRHLEDSKSNGELSLNKLLHLKSEVGDDIVGEIQEAFQKLGPERLRPIFDHFDGRYTYKSIRLARLLMS